MRKMNVRTAVKRLSEDCVKVIKIYLQEVDLHL